MMSTNNLGMGRIWGAAAVAVMLWAFAGTALAVSITDGVGDADRNNDGAITPYDTDVDLSGAIDGIEISAPEDAGDVGIIWAATRGFTSSGDPKSNVKIFDDSAGLGSGYALGFEAKGSGSSAAGYFGQSVAIGPNVGAKVVVQVDFRIWATSNNPTPPPFNGELRWGLFQDTDGQLGTSNTVGSGGASVVWGAEDGEWRDADPGAVGDKGIWSRIPIGAGSDPLAARINYENNSSRFLEGSSVGNGGDQDTVASPTGDGPGGQIGDSLANDPNNEIPLMPHTLMMEIVRTATSVEAVTFIDGVEILRDEIDPADPDVVILGPAPTSFDYVAFRNTGTNGDWDFVLDNFSIQTIPEPASALLLVLCGAAVGLLRRRYSRLR